MHKICYISGTVHIKYNLYILFNDRSSKIIKYSQKYVMSCPITFLNVFMSFFDSSWSQCSIGGMRNFHKMVQVYICCICRSLVFHAKEGIMWNYRIFLFLQQCVGKLFNSNLNFISTTLRKNQVLAVFFVVVFCV